MDHFPEGDLKSRGTKHPAMEQGEEVESTFIISSSSSISKNPPIALFGFLSAIAATPFLPYWQGWPIVFFHLTVLAGKFRNQRLTQVIYSKQLATLFIFGTLLAITTRALIVWEHRASI